MNARQTQVAFAGLALAGVILRLLFLGEEGYPTDVSTFRAWAERLADVGPAAFYAPGYFADYPPGYLYLLWLFGALFDGEALRLAVKAVSIPFDVAIAAVGAALAWRAGGAGPALLAAGLWLLGPNVIFAGTFWGQVDSVGTLPMMVALLAAGQRRWAIAGAVGALAALIKPQFGLGLVVVTAAAAFASWQAREAILGRHARAASGALERALDVPLLRTGASALAVILALSLPFRQTPLDLIDLVRRASETYPYSSLYAFNPWSIVADFWHPDEAFVMIGAALLFLGIAASCAPLWWRRDTAALLACGACAVFAFYFLPTRAHERYILPALALLLPFAALRTGILVPYVVLALGSFLSFHFVFTRYDLLPRVSTLEATFYARPGQMLVALLMTTSAAFIAWRLVRRDAVLAPERETQQLRTAHAGGARAGLLPAGLRPGYAPTRRDVALALLVALAVLASRGYRLDHPRDMYFDEVYHARTAYELLAQREPYEWTHPHLAKELMTLGILAFSGDRVTGREPAAEDVTAFAVSNDGLRAYGRPDGTIELRTREGSTSRATGAVAGPLRGLALSGSRIVAVTDSALIELATARAAPLGGPFAGGVQQPMPEFVTASVERSRAISGPPTALAASASHALVGTATTLEIHALVGGEPRIVPIAVVALTIRPDGSAAYVLDREGRVHVIDPATGTESALYEPEGPSHAVAYAQAPNTLFLARSDRPALDVIALEGGGRETVSLANARTGTITAPASALAVVPRTQFLYALAGDRLVVIETHGASPYASVQVSGEHLGVDGTGDEILVAGDEGVTRVSTGRQALSWRLPGVIAGAVLAFFLVLIARRLFASALAPALTGALLLLDGSMFAQPRIGMNDVYVGTFLVAGWYFVLAAHRPRRSAALDLLIAGVLFGLAAASKWVAFYALAGLGLLALVVTAYAYSRHRSGEGGPFDLLAGRGRNAAFLFLCFAVIPVGIYLLAYVPWSGGPTIPYGWDLVELTKQMYWYHSGLTSPHPAGSPWWSWPLVLKPVYWYFGQSEPGSAVIYDAGNVAIYWAALVATVWCAVYAIRARSLVLGFVVFALAVQLVAWIPITRVLFFYHFFTALPWYLLALVAALVYLWERGARALVGAYLVAVLAVFAFFYPFVSGLPVPADQTGAFFILPTWQYDCQFYPAFTCPVGGGAISPSAVAARLAPAVLAAALGLGAWWLARTPQVRAAVAAGASRWSPRRRRA